MNYKKTYQALINRAIKRCSIDCYTERHHIIPVALGGSDDDSNIAVLTAREHFIAHMLLAKIHGGHMWYAVIIMKGGINRYCNSRLFEVARKNFSREREKAIKEKRKICPVYDELIRQKRSLATKNRKEGYQIAAGERFKERYASDQLLRAAIAPKRKKANTESLKVKYAKNLDRISLVRELRLSGAQYKEISSATGYSIAMISQIVNNKQCIGVGVY